MHILISIIGIIVTILFVVGTHEFGHFIVARLVGVKVLRFSIGFGKRLFGWTGKNGTEYVFALFPLGGYVQMLGEGDDNYTTAEKHMAYSQQPYYKKFLIVAAGPITNFICAFGLYWLIFTLGFVTVKPVIGEITKPSIAQEAGIKAHQEITQIDGKEVKTWTNVLFRILEHTGSKGTLTATTVNPSNNKVKEHKLNLATWSMDKLKPNPLASLGIEPYEPPLKLDIGYIRADSAAAKSKLKLGDKLIAIDKKPVKNWEQVIQTVQANPNKELVFTVMRHSKKMDIPVTIGSSRNIFFQQRGVLGIAPFVKMPERLKQTVKYSPTAAIPRAATEVVDFTKFNLMLFGKMVTGKISLESLGGPITIFDTAGDSLNYGFLPFISFLAFLSISIGIINLFPIPGLDGGHLFIQTIEAISRRSIPENVVLLMYRLGFLFIIFILIQALINDVLRLT